MAATANSFIASEGEITLTVDAGEATATGITAGTYTFDIVVRKFSPVTEPERTGIDTEVTGGTIRTLTKIKGNWEYELIIVDDYLKGETGELAGSHTVVEVLQAYHDALESASEMTVTPAGSNTGMIEWTITDVEIQKVSGPMINADSEELHTRTVLLSFERDNISKAAHA